MASSDGMGAKQTGGTLGANKPDHTEDEGVNETTTGGAANGDAFAADENSLLTDYTDDESSSHASGPALAGDSASRGTLLEAVGSMR